MPLLLPTINRQVLRFRPMHWLSRCICISEFLAVAKQVGAHNNLIRNDKYELYLFYIVYTYRCQRLKCHNCYGVNGSDVI